ncbi:NAD-dependent epimerase/dehydratase family protein [Alphaproteobacteria bacterium]|nr:NAD-dependent epimerase/dehydratase family protein [Alphaproteobacteria bacterium]
MNVMILGGDGFCGWPTSLRLSKLGFNVCIVDNFSRRNIDIELGTESLTPIKPLEKRIASWKSATGLDISFKNIDVANDYAYLKNAIETFAPTTIINFAEQRAAPYSMKSPWHKHFTITNNLGSNCNLLAAIAELKMDIHVVHLGTMGVYGYGTSGFKIPEGYVSVKVDGTNQKQEILYPASPGSIYHLTKCQDQLLFAFYAKNDGIRITDLHQGIVWGTETLETRLDEDLINRFDYDGDFGTVLNRFIMQSQLNYPLTVHGSGRQTRAFINIQDTVNCIELVVKIANEDHSRVRIMNQMTETQNVIGLAQTISDLTGVEIAHLDNPRKEADENELHVTNDALLDLGLNPVFIENGLLTEIAGVAKKYKDRCDVSKIPCISNWS